MHEIFNISKRISYYCNTYSFVDFSIRSSHSEIQNLKVQLENTKNNLFQTNEIVALMQKQLAEKS